MNFVHFFRSTTSILRPGANLTPLASSVRFRTRRSTRLKREALKARMKAIRAAQPPPEPKKSFTQKVVAQLMRNREDEASKKVLTLSTSWPSRTLQVDEENFRPEDDVFRISTFGHTVSFTEALEKMRRLNHKTVYDDPAAPVQIRLDLNMNLDIEAKEFIENFKQMIVLPHPFEFGKRRVVMAFTKQPDAQMAAREAGAEFAGGEEVIKKIKRGEFKVDEVDYFVANLDLLSELSSIRGLLRDKLPSHNNGLLGLDVVPLVRHFRNAVTLEVKRDETNAKWGACSTLVGRLTMSNAELESNAAFIVKRLCEHRPSAKSLGHFVQRACLLSSERRVFYQWNSRPMAPVLPDDDSALQAMADKETDKKLKRKKKK